MIIEISYCMIQFQLIKVRDCWGHFLLNSELSKRISFYHLAMEFVLKKKQ